MKRERGKLKRRRRKKRKKSEKEKKNMMNTGITGNKGQNHGKEKKIADQRKITTKDHTIGYQVKMIIKDPLI